MKTFATIKDLQSGWETIPPSKVERANTLLIRASAKIIQEFRDAGREIDLDDEVTAINLVTVCCDMVRRVLGTETSGDYASFSQTAGSYTEQITLANPSGNLYLSAEERRMLKLPKQRMRIGCIRPAIGGMDD